MQTSLLGLGELIVTMVLPGLSPERLDANQWIGALLIA
jgi:hypothetical protein